MLDDPLSVFESDLFEPDSPPSPAAAPVEEPPAEEAFESAPEASTPTEETHYFFPKDEIEFRREFRKRMEEDPLIRQTATNYGSRKIQQEFAQREREYQAELTKLRKEADEQRQRAIQATFNGMTPQQFGEKYATDANFRQLVFEANKAQEAAATRQPEPEVDQYVMQAHEDILAAFDEALDHMPQGWVDAYRQQYLSGQFANYTPVQLPAVIRNGLREAAAEFQRQREAARRPTAPSEPPAPTNGTLPAAANGTAVAVATRPTVSPGNNRLAEMRSDLQGRVPVARTVQGLTEAQWQAIEDPDQMQAYLSSWGVQDTVTARRLGLIK